MLIIWRSVGQGIRIGDGLLTVDAIRRSVHLTHAEGATLQRHILTRRKDLHLHNCRVVLVDKSATEVRLGLDAPESVRIQREELLSE